MKIVITLPDSVLDSDGGVSDEACSGVVDYIGEVRDQIMRCLTSGHVDAETHWEIQRD